MARIYYRIDRQVESGAEIQQALKSNQGAQSFAACKGQLKDEAKREMLRWKNVLAYARSITKEKVDTGLEERRDVIGKQSRALNQIFFGGKS